MGLRVLLGVLMAASLVACSEGLPSLNESDQSSTENPYVPPEPLEPTPLNPPPVPPRISEFHWSYGGVIANKTCVNWAEPGDPHTWEDNFLCTDRNLNLTWQYGLPLYPLKTCLQIVESSDPHTWSDNYLCAPSDIGLRWSSDGPIVGMQCLAIIEPAEPLAHTWGDNYLCLPQ